MFMWLRDWRAGSRRRPAEGQALILFALMAPVLAGITGLALDGGNLYFQRRALQSIADSAAITGAQVANFNIDTPQILPDGVNQARTNAVSNGATTAEVTVNWPPSAVSGMYYNGRLDYIEVIVTRSVPNPFMRLFGMGTSTISARAVARCYKPGYGSPAVLALSQDPEAITFNGGSSQAVNIVGDVVSHGGIDPNGNASHFQIVGSAYALTQPAATNLTTTNGSYGTDTGPAYWDMPDPVVQGENAQPPTVVWPYQDFDPVDPDGLASMPVGQARICDNPWSGGNCNPNPPGADTKTGNFTVGSNKYAKFTPGRYGNVTIRGDAEFASGIYSFNSLDLGAGAHLTDNGDGVLIHVRGGAGLRVDVSGGAEFTLSAYPGNTWMDIVLYVTDGDIDMTGNGEREINGSVYCPNGNVAISGNGGDAIVNGQVIASTVEFSGNGPTVNYSPNGTRATFGPVLVNTP